MVFDVFVLSGNKVNLVGLVVLAPQYLGQGDICLAHFIDEDRQKNGQGPFVSVVLDNGDGRIFLADRSKCPADVAEPRPIAFDFPQLVIYGRVVVGAFAGRDKQSAQSIRCGGFPGAIIANKKAPARVGEYPVDGSVERAPVEQFHSLQPESWEALLPINAHRYRCLLRHKLLIWL